MNTRFDVLSVHRRNSVDSHYRNYLPLVAVLAAAVAGRYCWLEDVADVAVMVVGNYYA